MAELNKTRERYNKIRQINKIKPVDYERWQKEDAYSVKENNLPSSYAELKASSHNAAETPTLPQLGIKQNPVFNTPYAKDKILEAQDRKKNPGVYAITDAMGARSDVLNTRKQSLENERENLFQRLLAFNKGEGNETKEDIDRALSGYTARYKAFGTDLEGYNADLGQYTAALAGDFEKPRDPRFTEEYGAYLKNRINDKRKELQDKRATSLYAGPSTEDARLYEMELTKQIEALESDYEAWERGMNTPSLEAEDIYRAINDEKYLGSLMSNYGGESGNNIPADFTTVSFMTQEERDRFNELYKTDGPKKALQFFSTLSEAANYRQGEHLFKSIFDIKNPVGRTLATAGFALNAGADQWVSGARQLRQEEALSSSPLQIASSMIRENLRDVGPDIFGNSLSQALYDAGTTVGNMLPSITVSILTGGASGISGVGQLAGAATLGASAGGNAYTQALNEGYEPEAAKRYATAVAISESALQYVLGGISGLSSKAGSRIFKNTKLYQSMMGAMKKMDGALLRLSVDGALDAFSEGTEEFLQVPLETWFRNVFLGEENDIVVWTEDSIYSFLLGALTSAGMNSATAIPNISNYYAGYQDAYSGSDLSALINEGLASEPNTKTYELASKMQSKVEKGRTLSGRSIYNLAQAENQQAIRKDAETRLTALGETQDADKKAEVIAKNLTEQPLTRAEQDILYRSRFSKQVAEEIQIDRTYSDTLNRDGVLALKTGYQGFREANPNSPVTLQEYASEFTLAYAYGKKGASLETTRESDELYHLSAATIRAAHSAGVRAGKAETLQQAQSKTEAAQKPAVKAQETETREDIDLAITSAGNMPDALQETVRTLYAEYGGEVAASDFTDVLATAYRYGSAGLRATDISASENVPSEAIEKAYNAGRDARRLDMERRAAAAREERAQNKGTRRRVRSITEEEAATYNVNARTTQLSKRQRAAVEALEILSNDIGVDVVLFESPVNAQGEHTGALGFYANGTVYLDIHAGYGNEQAMLRTAGHELTHYLREASPVLYEDLKDFLLDYYYQQGDSTLTDLIDREMAADKSLDEVKAVDEVVANACEMMLRDSAAAAKLESEHKDVFTAIKKWIDNFAKAIKRAFDGISAHEQAAVILEKSADAFQEVQRIWYNALSEVSEAQNSESAEALSGDNFSLRERIDAAKERNRAMVENRPKMEVVSETKSDGAEPVKSSENTEVKKKPKVKRTTSKPRVVETTAKLEDFGEKIGGARKDMWTSRGLYADDLESMNGREAEKYVKKDNVWKRPDYRKLVEGGADRGILYAVNEIRKSINQTLTYQKSDTAEKKTEKQKLFIETTREIQDMAEKAQTAAEFRAMGYDWALKNGYLEDTGGIATRYRYTQKWYDNPVLQGSSYIQTVEWVARNFSKLSQLAEKKGFAADTTSKVPAGYAIHQNNSSPGYEGDGLWYITKGHIILKDGIASYDEALTLLRTAIASKKTKTRFVPKQLLEVHRKGPDYRASRNVDGSNYIDTFGFHGGEFGNWMSEKDRQVSLNYGFDALKDLSDALGIADRDISFGGNLSIAFGARGQGLSGASAHYERDRRVINLTKMNGAGSLAHEWFHALDDYIGGYGDHMASDHVRALPETTQAAMKDLIGAMQYRDQTDAESDLAATKRYEQAKRAVERYANDQFRWVEKLENETLTESDTRYFKRNPQKEDAARYHELLDKLLETGDAKYVEELSALRKDIVGRVIPKEERDAFGYRLYALRPDAVHNVQKARVPTEYYKNSRRFGEIYSKDGDYWDSTVEMAARAFACYVADKTGKQNDYLSAHSDSAVTLDSGRKGDIVVVRAFPEGKERTAINAAFDKLFAALKADGFLSEREAVEKPADIRYSKRKEFPHDVDMWNEDGRPNGETFILGATGDVLQGLGAIENDIYMFSDKINTIMHEHPEMTLDEIKRIPEILDDPVLVLKSKGADKHRDNTRLVLFGTVKAQNGNPVMSVLDLRPREGRLVIDDMQKVNSAYTKTGNAANFIQNSDVLHADKNRTIPLLRLVGLTIASRRLLHHGSIGTISYAGGTVKIQGVPFSEIVSNVQYQQRDPDAVTDRAVLANALESAAVNDTERDWLARYKAKIADIEVDAAKLNEINAEIREISFSSGKRDMDQLTRLKNQKKILQNRISRIDQTLLKLERAKPLARVLEVEKAKAVKRAQAQGNARLAEYRESRKESADRLKYRTSIQKTTQELTTWIARPTNQKHVPAFMERPLADFLASIDLTSKTGQERGQMTAADRKFQNNLQALYNALNRSPDKTGADVYEDYVDIPQQLRDDIEEVLEELREQTGENRLWGTPVNLLSTESMQKLAGSLKTIRHIVTNANKTLAVSAFAHVDELAKNSIQHMEEVGRKKDMLKTLKKADDFLQWDNIMPVFAFDRFGEGGKALFQALKKAQATLAFDSDAVIAFAKETYKKEEVRAWEREIHTIIRNGKEVRVTAAQLMELYNLWQREQGQGHIFGGGVTFSAYKGENGVQVTDRGDIFSYEELRDAMGQLSERQIKVAQDMQKYLSTVGAQWGNEISMKRFGIRSFTEEHYWPLRSDKNVLSTAADAVGNALYRLLNMCFTKPLTVGANNRIIIGNAFDTFAGHMSDMAQYHSFALPVLDLLKWLNYKETQTLESGQVPTKTMKEVLDATYGKNTAQRYVLDLLADINGNKTVNSQLGLGVLGRFNRQAVLANLRVAIMQPTAIARAGLIISPKYLTIGLKGSYRKSVEEMHRYSGIAKWKDMGFFEVNVSRNLTDLIRMDKSRVNTILDIAGKPAEIGDRVTWAAIWRACRAEAEAQGKYKAGSEEFFQAVAERFDDIIYRTQVVDSILTKSDFMRKPDLGHRMLSAFMSEPTTTYNMLLSAKTKYSDDARAYGKGEAWRRNGRYITRVLSTYVASAALTAFAEALAQVWRDDDDYEDKLDKFMREYQDALKGNLDPFSLLPVINQTSEGIKYVIGKLLKGLDNEDLTQVANILGISDSYKPYAGLFEWVDDAYSLVESLFNDNYTDYGRIYKGFALVSGFTGLPISSATREAAAIWNHTLAVLTGKKAKTYDPGPEKNVKYAYADGFLTKEEAIEALVHDAEMAKGEAERTVADWDKKNVKESFVEGRLTDKDAVAMLMKDSGITEKAAQETVYSWEKTRIKTAYDAGTLSEMEAITELNKTSGMSNEDAVKTVNSWNKSELRESYQNGELSESEAIAQLQRESGLDADEAYWTVKGWKFEKETGEDYDKYKSFYDAVRTGKNIKNVIAEYTKHGVTKEQLSKQITANFKPEFLELSKTNRVSAASLQAYLLNAYELLGYSRIKKLKDLRAWLDEKEEKKK
jgi:hypothetical protein